MTNSVEKEIGNDESFSLELPAPPGWKKKFVTSKGRTPKKNEVIFTTPTGESISSRKQLNQFLKANPGGPAISQFDWSVGDSPRRSARIGEKAKAIPISGVEFRNKRRRTSKKGSKETEDAPEVIEEIKKVHMQEAIKTEKNVDKNKAEDVAAETEAAHSEGAKGGAYVIIPTEDEDCKDKTETEPGNLKESEGGEEVDGSETTTQNKIEGTEDLKVEKSEKQKVE